ncbi:TerB family tellurite resistance protein [Emcibacter nanhaiensis]|uniref:Molecular chaperone DjiA n=1 Tax=Emcibacter nanhaiensis TaxID=1505037 RepID=A0A501PB62_9PROT|nr:TerB family tellurite resistance protein [Emcibacter nanhaiensis]TPD57639.1 molecular chaperone DjiA [Emcibacter nanhaiensis]
MSVWGTLLGGAAGLALGGPIGALVGAFAGHMATKKLAEKIGAPLGEAREKITFTIGVIALSAKMAKADGRVTRDEVNVFKQAFRVPEGEARNVGRIFDLARREATGYEPYARQLAQLFRDQPVVLEELLDILFHIALADGVMHPAEENYLEHVARLFGFGQATYQRIRESHMGKDRRDPYVVLGVERSATDQEIKARYRQLIKEHHPDLLIAKGVPEEFIEVANEKLAAINEAYDNIANERNMN